MQIPQGVTFQVDGRALQQLMEAATFTPADILKMRDQMMLGVTDPNQPPLAENPLHILTQQCNEQVKQYEINNP